MAIVERQFDMNMPLSPGDFVQFQIDREDLRVEEIIIEGLERLTDDAYIFELSSVAESELLNRAKQDKVRTQIATLRHSGRDPTAELSLSVNKPSGSAMQFAVLPRPGREPQDRGEGPYSIHVRIRFDDLRGARRV